MLARAFTVVAVLAAPSIATAAEQQPYAGIEARQIKALSAEEIEALQLGKGFSQALSAELNGFPGPRQVLDMAERLELKAVQRSAIEDLFGEMRAEAIAVGAAVLAKEADLEGAFREDRISETDLIAASEEIGRLRGKLRGIHLKYHLRTTAILAPHQIALYNTARGYTATHSGHGGHPAN